MSTNPYTAPKSDFTESSQDALANPLLWNPNAAANWCLLLSVAFGAFLHMKNWEALGEPEKARHSRIWFIVSIGWLLTSCLLDIVLPEAKALDAISRVGFLVMLIVWYVSSAKPQIRYVQARFGKDYRRQPWGKPFLFVLASFVGLNVFLGAAAYIHAVMTGAG